MDSIAATAAGVGSLGWLQTRLEKTKVSSEIAFDTGLFTAILLALVASGPGGGEGKGWNGGGKNLIVSVQRREDVEMVRTMVAVVSRLFVQSRGRERRDQG
jgi:hypothetical protein